MISVYKVKDIKYCSHCNGPAAFEIMIENEKVIQNESGPCLCVKCKTILEECLKNKRMTVRPRKIPNYLAEHEDTAEQMDRKKNESDYHRPQA